MSEVLFIGEPGTGKSLMALKFANEYKNIVWISTTRSSRMVRRFIGRNDVWIVDTHTWSPIRASARDVIIGNPLNLNEVSLGIGRVLDRIEDKYIVVLDSISGLLIYHSVQRVLHFLRNLLVRIEGDGCGGMFILVKNAHDLNTELSVAFMFSNIIELSIRIINEKIRRFIRVIKSAEFIEPDFFEFKIEKEGIEIPKNIEEFIKRQLRY